MAGAPINLFVLSNLPSHLAAQHSHQKATDLREQHSAPFLVPLGLMEPTCRLDMLPGTWDVGLPLVSLLLTLSFCILNRSLVHCSSLGGAEGLICLLIFHMR